MKRFLLSIVMAATTMATMAQASLTKSMFVHLKSGATTEIPCADIDSITFGESSGQKPATEINVTHTMNIYYGDAYGIGKGAYLVCLSDGEITPEGLPTEVGQHLLRLLFMADKSDNYTTATIADGTYNLSSDSTTDKSLYSGESVYLVCTGYDDDGNVTGYQYDLASAQAIVTNTDNLTTKIEATVTLNSEEDETLKFTYDGQLKFDNGDPTTYVPLDKDVSLTDLNASGRYTTSSDEKYGNYSVTFYNCELDDDGFVVGEGSLINFEIFTPYSKHMDLSKLAGTYTPVTLTSPENYTGHFMEGTWYPIYGDFYSAIGTYYTYFDENGSNTCYGLVKDGTVTVNVDGDNATFTLEGTTPEGKKVSMTSTANKSAISDFTQDTAEASAKPKVKFNGTRRKAAAKSKVFTPVKLR